MGGDFSRPFPVSARCAPRARRYYSEIEQLFTGGHIARDIAGFERRLQPRVVIAPSSIVATSTSRCAVFLAGVRMTSGILERFYPQPRVGRQRRGDDG